MYLQNPSLDDWVKCDHSNAEIQLVNGVKNLKRNID